MFCEFSTNQVSADCLPTCGVFGPVRRLVPLEYIPQNNASIPPHMDRTLHIEDPKKFEPCQCKYSAARLVASIFNLENMHGRPGNIFSLLKGQRPLLPAVQSVEAKIKKKLILISVEMESLIERNVPATSEIRCPLKFIIIILRTPSIGEDGTEWVGQVNNACCLQIN